ncbi:MAG: hypothetical protein ACOCTI_08255 [Phycisphaeraceae bacterium]
MAEIDPAAEGDLIQQQDLRELMNCSGGPCISIYMPTTRYPSHADENRIRYKTLLRQVQDELGLLEDQHAEQSDLLRPLRSIMDDQGFWGDQRNGLAIFRSADQFRIRRLLHEVPERAVVADSFHIRPLLRIVQHAGRYQILAVTNERVALYEGVGDQDLTVVPLHPEVPRDMAEAIGEPSRVAKTRRTMYDQGETDARDAQLSRYFRRLDKAIWERHSRRSNLPLILAALPEYQTIFRDASHNPLLVDRGIEREPVKDLDERQLRKLAWEVTQPKLQNRLAELREKFGSAKAHEKASADLRNLAQMAAFGRLETLMICDEYHVGGRIDRGTGEIEFEPIANPAVDDAVDDLAEIMISQDAEVIVADRDDMPEHADVAGIQRF